jgi:hypothetical protein
MASEKIEEVELLGRWLGGSFAVTFNHGRF